MHFQNPYLTLGQIHSALAYYYDHKAAIDEHLKEAGIAVGYTNVFWGGRSEIKPSEVLPGEYEAWCRRTGVDPASMRAR